jgi:hypothetical protein
VALLGGDNPNKPETVDCVILRCGTEVSFESTLWQSSPLVLFGSVLLVRLLFLVGEYALLLRVIAYNERVYRGEGALVVRVAQRVGALDPPGNVPLRTSTISFTNEVRELFRGYRRSTWTTYALIISVFVQVVFWYDPEPYYLGSSFRL